MVDRPPDEHYDWSAHPAWYQSQTGAWIHYEDLAANHKLRDRLMPEERRKFDRALLDYTEGK